MSFDQRPRHIARRTDLAPGRRARGSWKPIRWWFSGKRWLGLRGSLPKPSSMLRSALRAYRLCAHVRDERAAGGSRTRAWRKQRGTAWSHRSAPSRRPPRCCCKTDLHRRWDIVVAEHAPEPRWRRA
ncbi:uncharacterized protein LOC100384104 [Zea mays]|uniref:Uncharacterized protein n=1 Tax=Zea mays TaxID=4577 RepID=C0PLJ8_MAIZE|nr:uncharacterized protein LOC100384104 [Zea mays]ACN36064.1 unknown [Zea mays]|eukprot:NP_001170165.1 uncharacterized protein LOC100384104 [Zea mays]